MAVEECQDASFLKCSRNLKETPLMDPDTVTKARLIDILLRQSHVFRILINSVNRCFLRAIGEPEGRIAKSGAEFDDAASLFGRCHHAKERTIVEWISPATVLFSVGSSS